MTQANSVLASDVDLTNHPALTNSNETLSDRLSPTEKACRRIADATGAPLALVAAIVFQLMWIAIGTATKLDPYPFVFLLTCSNVVQLVLIFVIAVAQRQSATHDSIRAEADHAAISRLLFHQQVQERALLRIGEKLGASLDAEHAVMRNLSV